MVPTEAQRAALTALVDTVVPTVARDDHPDGYWARAAEAMSAEAAIAVRQLKSLALLLSYALPDETGRSPFWSTLGYPGPLSDPPDVERGISAYLPSDALSAVPIGLGGYYCGSAHQMGSARMGTDPPDNVTDTRGELPDTPGVWIGDTSAFPTSSGTNPMLTCMAHARRTARRMLESTEP